MAVIFSLAIASYAQRGPGRGAVKSPEDRASTYTNWIDKTVTLTADQKTKVQAVNLKYAKMKQEVRDSSQANRQGMRQGLIADNQEQDAELKGILTSDQYTAFIAARKQRADDMRKRRRNRQ